jgi:hypothetical protein
MQARIPVTPGTSAKRREMSVGLVLFALKRDIYGQKDHNGKLYQSSKQACRRSSPGQLSKTEALVISC